MAEMTTRRRAAGWILGLAAVVVLALAGVACVLASSAIAADEQSTRASDRKRFILLLRANE